MDKPKSPAVTNPDVDIAELIRYTIGDTGELRDHFGGFRILVFHTKGFPWADIFKMLLYRDFRVYVTRNKADLMIEVAI